MALKYLQINIHTIVRPRGGDFLYSDMELDNMRYDIYVAKTLGVHGVVFGCLTPAGNINVQQVKKLVHAAKPLSVTFHRAFDVCQDPLTALEQLIDLGCDRVLTSGQQPTAIQGVPLIAQLVQAAKDRIIVMPGCGINPTNIQCIQEQTGAKEFHASARTAYPSQMIFRNTKVPMHSSNALEEFVLQQTDAAIVRQLVEGCD
jgi:copper homeostasis protein